MVIKSPKGKGTKGENIARDHLKLLGFLNIERTGSLNYYKDAPDLVQSVVIKGSFRTSPIRIVTTQDNYGPLLVTMSAADLGDVLAAFRNSPDLSHLHTVVQCKKTKSSYIGRLWRELKLATS